MSMFKSISRFHLAPEQSREIVSIAHLLSGLALDPNKTDFLELRLTPRLLELGLNGFEEYIRLVRSDLTCNEGRRFVESLTTHTTSFFREAYQYEWLENEGLDYLASTRSPNSGPLTVWSAAASTGAELWSAGMLLAEAATRNRADFSSFALIGTDISDKILRRANAAVYTMDEISGISERRRVRFLSQSKSNWDNNARPLTRIVPDLRRHAEFICCNLADLKGVRSFVADLIFLRNVLIYFKDEEQKKIISAVLSRLRKGGVLLTGHTESLSSHTGLELIRPSIYKKI